MIEVPSLLSGFAVHSPDLLMFAEGGVEKPARQRGKSP
jgi:hypothetical protein